MILWRCSRVTVLALATAFICCVFLVYFASNTSRNANLSDTSFSKIRFDRDNISGNTPQESQLDSPSSTTEENSEDSWGREYTRRLENARDVCEKYDVQRVRAAWNLYSNRLGGHLHYHCATRQCPVLVDERKRLYFCFIQKVGSTTMKEHFLNLANVTTKFGPSSNNSVFHQEANEALYRISPMFLPEYIQRRFYKALFVRHPFDRLVSAFVDKGERSRQEVPFFYGKYWDKIMRKFRGESNVTEDSRPTFKEFVKYLLDTQPLYYDEHWAPYWSRCDACWVKYDFIGKLETAYHDLPHIFQQSGLDNVTYPLWENRSSNTRELTLKYFRQLSKQEIVELYKTYFLDFKIFLYSVEEFLPEQNVASIDESINLYALLY